MYGCFSAEAKRASLKSLLFLKNYFLCMGILTTRISVSCSCSAHWRHEEGIRRHETGVMDTCELPRRCWECEEFPSIRLFETGRHSPHPPSPALPCPAPNAGNISLVTAQIKTHEEENCFCLLVLTLNGKSSYSVTVAVSSPVLQTTPLECRCEVRQLSMDLPD